MSANRSRQARQLATMLTERAGVKVTLDYHDTVHIRGRAWHIHWTDGPTWRQMVTLAAGLADRFPSLDIAQMCPARSHTALGEAAAVLVWLHLDPANAEMYPSVWPQYACDAISYPESSATVWLRRAEALLSMAAGRIDSEVCNAVDARLRSDGWAGVLEWLDEIASGGRRLRAVQ
ncbi:hypothetical protein SAMN04244553_3564 [Nocardia amikacinitolerans]|uniref:Uncharacterized protein n=1 Tax=Nocardia amikacinitolerans TaxID=756689 RepID=A0A285LFQ8_9NOCA|nr:hypothetical protein [Nocardia amikacinitolerans]SNY83780.1 hypothetical protein SAMN04244553_3564 [Nocardia amikacinitolerans]